MQESTLGSTRISENIAREVWSNYLLAFLSSSPLAIPWIGALVSATDGQSEDLQKALLLAMDIGMIVVYASNMFQQLQKTRRVVESYERSIEALKVSIAHRFCLKCPQASLMVTAGGASRAASRMNGTARLHAGASQKPVYIRLIEQDILQLESARRNVKEDTKKVKVGVLVMYLRTHDKVRALSCCQSVENRFAQNGCVPPATGPYSSILLQLTPSVPQVT
eukprot:6189542-Pleurochrysis_carterae.AAC.1